MNEEKTPTKEKKEKKLQDHNLIDGKTTIII